jgi:S-adenosyl-L-methionine hydrolase (adenosine-forming)
MEPLITLTTDFGHRDPFVGIMKGVIYSINPDARVIDLTHGIPAQNVTSAALALQSSVRFFPQGTIHVAVVDPGVGSKRRALLIEAAGSFFVGPDNGIFSLLLNNNPPKQIIELTNEKYHLKPTSTTFHGRDIFAPIAAYLSRGIAPEEFGSPMGDFVRLAWPAVTKTEGVVQGQIVYIDTFGNLITNIREDDLGGIQSDDLTTSIKDITIRGLAQSYANGSESNYVTLVNSLGLLEISLFKGNAQLESGAQIGDRVNVRQSESIHGQ